ncbi:hypothetical protein B0T14DRAFT_272457 [Immersiella caudata]|uniref:Uncharacterized protein n=1 Tax=Immersiella caudata TaxID=314043 RepID=A0AA39WLC6_9PEZI|nr:hypothetical protein B0T14DRAFT_272457 [Immersiella caudata]
MTPITVALLATTSMFQVPPDRSMMAPGRQLQAPAHHPSVAIVEAPLRNHQISLEDMSDEVYGIPSAVQAHVPSVRHGHIHLRSPISASPGSNANGSGQEDLAPSSTTTLSTSSMTPHHSVVSAPTAFDNSGGSASPVMANTSRGSTNGSNVTQGENDVTSPSFHTWTTTTSDDASELTSGTAFSNSLILSAVAEVASLLLMASLLRHATSGYLSQSQRCPTKTSNRCFNANGLLKATAAPSQSTTGPPESSPDFICLVQDQWPCRVAQPPCRLSADSSERKASVSGMLNLVRSRFSMGCPRPSRLNLTHMAAY